MTAFRLVWLLGILLVPAALPADEPRDLQCFSLPVVGSPERSPRVSTRQERWCYWREQSQTLVFNADSDRFQPELAALVEWSPGHQITQITHGSLLRGQISLHRSRLVRVNPLPVPLDVRRLEHARGASVALPAELWLQARTAFREFSDERLAPFTLALEEGTFEAKIEDAKLPYAGYWWPFDGVPLAAGPRSPLGKYDGIVGRWTGKPSDAGTWERQNHSLTPVPWGGHCNGWAASSVLYPDSTRFLWDKDAQQVVLPSDIKGMLAEASFCVDFAFYGRRYYGNPGDDLNDIHPDNFHQVLVYYLNDVKKPVAFDYERDEAVDNNVITGYKMKIEKAAGHSRRFHVLAELRTHNYQPTRDEAGGPASVVSRTYEYTLDVDDSGQIVRGTWISDNPDFLWVPLAPKKECPGRNPGIDPDQVVKIASTLEEATPASAALGFSLKRTLAPHEEVSVPLSPLKGSSFRLAVAENNFAGGVKVVATGYLMYPTRGQEGVTTYEYYFENLRDDTLSLPLSDLTALKIVNDSDEKAVGNSLSLTRIEYLSGGK